MDKVEEKSAAVESPGKKESGEGAGPEASHDEEKSREAEFQANLGLQFEERKRWQEAIDYYTKSRRIFEGAGAQDQAAFQLMNIGRVMGKQDRYVEAIKHYRQAREILEAIEDVPTLNECIKELARYLYRTGKHDEAAGEYRHALEKGYGDSEISNNLGFIALEKEELKDARAHLEEALRKKREEGHAQLDLTLNNLGVIEYLEGNLASALACFSEAAQTNPRAAADDRTIAFVLHLSKGYEELGAKRFQAYDNALTKAAQHLNMATTLMALEKKDDALQTLQLALDLDRDTLYLYYSAAWIFLAGSDETRAFEFFRRSMNLSPGNEVVKNIILKFNPYYFMKIGRNDPCPCDSGRKFKKCHGAMV